MQWRESVKTDNYKKMPKIYQKSQPFLDYFLKRAEFLESFIGGLLKGTVNENAGFLCPPIGNTFN